MDNLEQLATRLDNLQTSLALIKYDLENELKKQETPKYELSDLMKETIQNAVDNFIRYHILDNLDSSYTVYASGDYCNVEMNIDLQEIVEDQMRSPYKLAEDFMTELQKELDTLKEEDETTEQGDEQHQDC
jgi:hypothetical protein